MCSIIWKQLFICSGTWTLHFLLGVCMGFPTVLLPQLRKENQTITTEQGSWLPAVHTYSGIPWVILVSALIVTIGRKKCQIIVSISTLLGFILFYFSTDWTHFLLGGIFHGALASSYLTINIVILTEYVSSKYRGIFLTFKSATFFWGVLVANAMGTYLHWRSIVILGLACSVYTLLNVIVWPESPLWLATKGRYAECAASHRWLKGTSAESEKDLAQILKCYDNKIFLKQAWGVRYLGRLMRNKHFYKPILLANILVCIYCFSGKLICTVYAIDILKKITSKESTAYNAMLILDGVTVTSMYFGCLISKFFKRRTILITFSGIGIAIMVIISIYLYLSKLAIIDENIYVSIFLLAAYSITISCGPMIMSTTIIGELLPLESRTLSMCIIALLFKVTNGTFIKLSPLCFKILAIHGTFAMYAVLSGICLVLIYLYVPETKDRTLQEIDSCLRGEEIKCIEENCELMNVDTKNVESKNVSKR